MAAEEDSGLEAEECQFHFNLFVSRCITAVEKCLFPFEQDSGFSQPRKLCSCCDLQRKVDVSEPFSSKSRVVRSSGMVSTVCRGWSGVYRDGGGGALTKSTLSYGSEEASYFHLGSKL